MITDILISYIYTWIILRNEAEYLILFRHNEITITRLSRIL